MSMKCPPEYAQPIAENRNSAADSIRMRLRPNRSLRKPATVTPRMHPISAELTYHPSMTGPSPNLSFTNPIVPEITAVSYPNRNPPSDAMSARRSK